MFCIVPPITLVEDDAQLWFEFRTFCGANFKSARLGCRLQHVVGGSTYARPDPGCFLHGAGSPEPFYTAIYYNILCYAIV